MDDCKHNSQYGALQLQERWDNHSSLWGTVCTNACKSPHQSRSVLDACHCSVWLDNQVNTTIMQNNQSMSTGPSEPASTEPSLPLPLHNPVWWTLTHSAAHSVPTMDKTYAAVKGSLSSVSRCLRWFQGPHRKEKLQVHTRDNICSTQTTTPTTGTCSCPKANIL